MGRSSLKKHHVGLFLTLAGAAVAAFFQLKIYTIGTFIDDARFILRAVSIAQGHYVALELPGAPPTNIPLPGYPLFLSPLCALVQPHWSWLKVITLLVSSGGVWLLWRLLTSLSVAERVAVVSLFAWNPLTGQMASNLLAESFFLPFLFLMINVVDQTMQKPSWGRDMALGLGLGWLSLVRPEAILAVPIILFPFIKSGQRRSFLVALAGALLVWGLVLHRNRLMTSSATNYLGQWAVSWHQSDNLLLGVLGQWNQIVRVFVVGSVLGLSAVPGWLGQPWLVWGAGVGLALVLAIGFRARWQSRNVDPRPLQLIGIGLALLVVHSFWLSFALHHFWPILPALLLLLVSGIQVIVNKAGKRRVGFAVSVGLFLVLFGLAQVRAYQAIRIPLPVQTLQWIREHTSSQEILFAAEAPTVSLYTQRPTVSANVGGGADSFYYHLLKANVRYALTRRYPTLSFHEAIESPVYRSGVDAQMARWLQDSPGAFDRVFQSEEEGASLYRIRPSPALLNAFPIYKVAMDELRDGNLVQGELKLRSAIAIDPQFPSALGALGTALMLLGKPLEGKASLEKAILLRPNEPLIRLNYARLLVRLGDDPGAIREYAKAADLASRAGEYSSLRQAAEREAAQIQTAQNSSKN